MLTHLEGVTRIECSDWNDFLTKVRFGRFTPHKRWFRGQRSNKHDLKPSLFRSQLQPSDEIEKEYIDNFRKGVLAIPKYRRLARQSEPEWWALAQHHGMPTPLLDWSINPYVAAFFAIAGQWVESNPTFAKPTAETLDTPTDPVAVWELQIEDDHPAGLSDLILYKEAAISNPRQRAQGGRFTRITGNADRDLIQFLRAKSQLSLLRVYEIPGDKTAVAFSDFQLMNLSFCTLFPDIDGIARNTILDSHLEMFGLLNPLSEVFMRQALAKAFQIEPVKSATPVDQQNGHKG